MKANESEGTLRGAALRGGSRGWTLVGLLAAIGIIVVIGTFIGLQVHQYYEVTWTGTYWAAPPTIPNGKTATYLYKVTGDSQAKGMVPGSGRPVQFILTTPGPNEGVIQSYTDASGTVTANTLSIDATTAADGSVSVVVKVDSQVGRHFALTYVDTGPGCSGMSCSEQVAITVIH